MSDKIRYTLENVKTLEILLLLLCHIDPESEKKMYRAL